MSNSRRVRRKFRTGPEESAYAATQSWSRLAGEFFNAGEMIKGTPTVEQGYNAWFAEGYATGYIKEEEAT